ncbi:MAG: hypothetical protein AUJ55_00175 [Proteobacteria bacterium CG1_02_64_396]|nr:MAG: hypothetical protein AUJ55_00175 [Proteobacteria bacterium CG1_02_64_396]
MQIPELIAHIARGAKGARDLDREQARWALATLMQPAADPLQLGAFLIALRMKGESAAELTGFVEAARDHVAGWGEVVAPSGALDLPCYAGRRRSDPLILAAALKLANGGTPVVVHGIDPIPGRIAAWPVLKALGIRRGGDLREGAAILASEGIVYLDLTDLCPPLAQLFNLRPRLGVRTFANTVARLLNPLRCDSQLNGVFHPPYVGLMAEINVALGQPRSLILKGVEGDPEPDPSRSHPGVVQVGEIVTPLAYPPQSPLSERREAIGGADAILARWRAAPPEEHPGMSLIWAMLRQAVSGLPE